MAIANITNNILTDSGILTANIPDSAFPSQTGNNGKYLTTDGSALSWGTVAGSMAIGGSITSATAGSVLFAGTSGVLQQDNANFFWDDANNRLGIGTNTPTYSLDISGSSSIVRIKSTTRYAEIYIGNDNINGRITYDNTNNELYLQNLMNTGKVFLRAGSNINVALFSTGNLLLQNGGTFTDAGFRLDVNGTARVNNTLAITGHTANVYLNIGSGVGTAFFGWSAYLLSIGGVKVRAENFVGDPTGTATGVRANAAIDSRGYLVTDSIGIGTTTSAINASAIAQINSTTKGFLPPRMTTTEKNAIATPAIGLVVYQTDATEGLYQYLSTGWSAVSGGGGSMAIGGSITSATAGSVLFAGTSGVLQQDNANFFWDDTNNRLGIGTATPANTLDVIRGTAGTMGRGVYESASFSFNGDMKFGLYTSAAAGVGGASLLFGATNFTAGGTYPGFELQFVPSATVASNYMRFNYVGRNATGTVTTSVADILSIFQGGNIVVGSGINAGFRLDVNGTARVSGLITASAGVQYTRLNPTTTTTASTATLTPDISVGDTFTITAQAVGLSVANPTGTPVNGQKMIIRIKDNGTARAITWSGTQYRASTALALPTTTIATKTMYLGFIYNSTDTKWDLLAFLNNF